VTPPTLSLFRRNRFWDDDRVKALTAKIINEQNLSLMNQNLLSPSAIPSAHVEFYRLPPPGKRDQHFGLSRSWYYKAAASGEIKMVSVRQRNALRGVRLIVYDSVADYIRRASVETAPTVNSDSTNGK